MPIIHPGLEIVDLFSFIEGLNTVKSGIRIDSTEMKDCQNIRYFPRGGFSWRKGYTELGNEPGNAATSLYMARFSSGTNIAFRTQGTKLEKMESLDGTWDDITGSLTLSSGKDNLFVFDILNDIVVGANDTNTCVLITSGLSASHISAPFTSALFVVQHRGYMFYGNVVVSATRQPGTLYFSDLNVPGTVQTNNFINVSGKTGGDLRGAVDYQGKLFCFKRNMISNIEFQPTRVNSNGDLFPFIENANPVVPGVGTQSHRSIVKFTTPYTHKTPGQELVFFVDQFGVPRLFDGKSSIAIGSSILTSRDSNIISLANVDKSQLPYIWAVNDPAKNLIHLFMTTSGRTQHDLSWVLDYNLSFAWSRDDYYDDFNCGALFEETDGSTRLYFGNYTGQVMRMDDGQNDNGVAISSYARTGDLFIQKVAVLSKWLYNEIRGTSGSDTQTLMVDYFVDGEDFPSISKSITLFKQNEPKWDENNWNEFNYAYVGLTTKSSEINTETKTLSVQFSNSTINYTHTIEGSSIFAIPEGWKQEA